MLGHRVVTRCLAQAAAPAAAPGPGLRRVTGALALVAALGVPWAVPAMSPGAQGEGRARLAVDGRRFVRGDRIPFHWRGVTAFALLEQVAHGREDEARAFLRWTRERGFNLVRVLGMAHNLFRLTPQEGVVALPRLLRLTSEAGVLVELVVFADTRMYPGLSLGDHAASVGRVLERAGRANLVVVELANENEHSAQDPALTDPRRLQSLRERLPAAVPVSLGSTHGADYLADRYRGGDYLTAHIERSGGPWRQAGRVVELAGLSRRVGKPVVSDEPIGAAERPQAGRRLSDPSVFFGMALLGRMGGVGSTFHCEDCLWARVPGPTQDACARAFIEGATLLPEAGRVEFVPPGAPGATPLSVGAVAGADGVYVAAVDGGQWHVVVALGLAPRAAMPWQRGWSATVLVERPGIRVFRAHRRQGQLPD